jgi:hypothetical protein
MVHILVEDDKGVSLVVDQHPVDAPFVDATNEPFRVAVRPGYPRRDLDHVDAFGGEHDIDGGGELGALFRIDPIGSVEFERGDCGEAEGEFSQRSTIPDGQNLPVLKVGNTAFDGGVDTREMFVRFNLRREKLYFRRFLHWCDNRFAAIA